MAEKQKKTLVPNSHEFAGRLYGLQEAAVIAGETTIGLAIYERIKLLEANAEPALHTEAIELAFEIADTAAPSFLDSSLLPESEGNDCWLDTRSADLDIADEIAADLRYCELRGLVQHHPTKPWLIQTLEP